MRRHSLNRCSLAVLLAVAAVVFCVPVEASGATISGTVYQSDGTTPLTGTDNIRVSAYTGSPCGGSTWAGSAWLDSATGSYTIGGLPAGTYYVQTSAWEYSSDNYIDEWWASPQSVRDCAGAQPVVVTEGQTVTGKNFQLDPGATISGTLYQSDGTTPLNGTDISVYAYTGSTSGGLTFVRQTVSGTGTYTITGLPAGTYYLMTYAIYTAANYIDEWWASPQSVQNRAGAQPVVVTEGQTVTGKNFQLDPGATISGTIYQSDGTTPLTGKDIRVAVFTSPSDIFTEVGSAWIDSGTGTYAVTRLPAGTYYVQASPSGTDNYISEWWASPQSVQDSAAAQPVVVTEQQAVAGKDFQLGPGATISGTVYQSDGTTPLLTDKQIWVDAYTGSPCGTHTLVRSGSVDSATGTYTIAGLPAGTYYLVSMTLENDPPYAGEWWASPQSVRDCAGAQPVVVAEGQTVTGKNFQLEPVATVVVNPDPDSINAPWTLTGPGGYSRSGTGGRTINIDNPVSGDYTLTWGNVIGWTKPSPASSTLALAAGGTVTFAGTYIDAGIPQIQITPSPLDFGYVPPGSYKDMTLTVKNIGTGILTGTVSASPPFSIVSGGSYSLGANQTKAVVVRYTAPLQEVSQTASLSFTGGGGSTVQVKGTNMKPRGLPWLQLLLGD